MDSPVLWCSLPQILPPFLIYLRNVGSSNFSPKLEKFTTCKWLTRKERSGLMPLMKLRLFRPYLFQRPLTPSTCLAELFPITSKLFDLRSWVNNILAVSYASIRS
jgi:hypothetical protein